MVATKLKPLSEDEKMILGALSSDLKRVAMSLYRNSPSVAKRFLQEALSRKSETQNLSLPPYLQKIMQEIERSLRDTNNPRIAEACLMYSTLIQNYVLSL